MSLDPSIALACRVFGALVFAGALAGKLRHRHELTGVVANYRVLPASLAAAAAWGLLALEALVVASLALGARLAEGAGLAMALLVVFAGAIAVNLARGRREIDCGCFQSGLRQNLSGALIARNLLLATALCPLLAHVGPPVQPLQWIDGLGAGMAAYGMYRILDRLLALGRASAELRKRFA